MSQSVLLITPMEEAEKCAAQLAEALGCRVKVAASYRAGLVALRRLDYAVVILDDRLVESNPTGAELLWKNSGLAVPLQINFATSGGSRFIREIRTALARREREKALAARAAAAILESELKSTLTGLLLQSQLALAEPALTDRLSGRLKMMSELTHSLRRTLERAQTTSDQ